MILGLLKLTRNLLNFVKLRIDFRYIKITICQRSIDDRLKLFLRCRLNISPTSLNSFTHRCIFRSVLPLSECERNVKYFCNTDGCQA